MRYQTPAEEWQALDEAAPIHGLTRDPRLSDAIRPDHADPLHLTDLAGLLALSGGTIDSLWQGWGPAYDQAETARRVRTFRTLRRLGVLGRDHQAGPGVYRLRDPQAVAQYARAAGLDRVERAQALAYAAALWRRPSREEAQASADAWAAGISAAAARSLAVLEAAHRAAVAERRPAADVLPFPRGGRDALRRQTIAGQQRQRLAEAIAI